MLVDIAVPRDIAPDVQELNNVYLYDVDDLEIIVRENVRSREHELARCQGIIDDRASAVLARFNPANEMPRREPIVARRAWAFAGAAI